MAALERLDPSAARLHLYSQPADQTFLEEQERYAAEHPWFGSGGWRRQAISDVRGAGGDSVRIEEFVTGL